MINHEVTEAQVIRAHRGVDNSALIGADDVIVRDLSTVGVVGGSWFQNDGEVAAFSVGELNAVACLERT